MITGLITSSLVVPASPLAAALGGMIRVEAGWAEVTVARQPFRFLIGAPLYQFSNQLLPLAAAASLVTFAVGALIPLLPFLLGFDSLASALILAGIAAFVGGGTVAKITDRPFLRGAIRQLLLAAAAAGATYGIGTAVGAVVG